MYKEDIPKLGIFSQPCFKRIFSNCLSHNSPAKGWPYRFRSRGTTGSSMLDHDLGHLCRGRRIQMSGHSDFGTFNDLGASSIFTWVSADTASAGCPAHPGSLEKMSMTFAAVILRCWRSLFSEHCIRTRVVFYNITAENNSTFVLLVLCLQFSIFPNDICPSVRRNELLRPSSWLHRSPLSYFWISSGSTPKFSPNFSIPCPLLPFAAGISWLEA